MNKNKKADELNCRKYIANVVGADDSVCPKKQRGITLIALVITIIVMLILVGVTVSIAINGGLFGTAKQATVEMRASQVEEQVETWKAVKEASNYIEGSRAQTLEELLNDLESQNLITKEEKAEIEENGQITIGTKNIVFLDISDYVYVGDYVNYEPQTETTSYEFEDKYTGYAGDKDADGVNDEKQVINQDKLKWRVLNINDNGTVDLISDEPTSTSLHFNRSLGYNNGVYLLNDFCKTLYSNSEYMATARSINREDIEDKMDLSVWDYHDEDDKGFKIGSTKTYTLNENTKYPYEWTQEKSETNKIDEELINGTLSSSEQNELTEQTYQTAEQSITITTTSYDKVLSKNNFKKVKTRNDDNDSNMYYDIFMECNSSDPNEYILATRYAYNGFNNNPFYYDFGLCFCKLSTHAVLGHAAFRSISVGDEPKYDPYGLIRIIVTLPIGHIDLSTNYEEAGAWNLK